MTSRHLKKPASGKAGIAWLLGAVAVTAAVVVGVLTAGGFQGRQETGGIADLAPADADTVVITPGESQWWPSVAALAHPDTAVLGLDPAEAGVELSWLGYTRSPDHLERVFDGGPLRLFYVEAETPEDAQKVADWLNTAEGFNNRNVHLQGRVVVVGASWVSEYEKPAKAHTAASPVAQAATGGKAAMWMDIDQEPLTLAGEDADTAQAYTDVLRSAYGFQEGTTWVGTSTDGTSWKGEFESGGVDPELIDFPKVQEVLESRNEVLAEHTAGNTTFSILDKGFGELLSYAYFTSPLEDFVMGSTQESARPGVEDAVVASSTSVTGWEAAVTGTYSYQENIGSRHLSASETEMSLELERYAE